MIRKIATAIFIIGGMTQPVLAAEKMISAHDPNGMFAVMEGAGYEGELDTDGVGDPLITAELGGWDTYIYFYGCDDETHDKCDSLQFRTGFDRAQPWSAAQALEIPKNYRYAAVQLDEEGDPFVTWDLVTGDGIPRKVFLAALRSYEQALHNAASLIFAEERVEEAK